MFGIERKDIIPVINLELLSDGVNLATVKCRNFEKYESLPEVMEVDSKLFNKMGWNSDIGIAYYKDIKKFGKGK